MILRKVNKYFSHFYSSVNLPSNFSKCTAIILLVCFISNSSTLSDDEAYLILTPSEKAALENFKRLVSGSLTEPFMKTDFYLIRWIRVANLDIAQARQLLMQTVEWRQKNNISRILYEDFSDMAEDFPININGHDKDGRPIIELHIGDWDIRAATHHGRIGRLHRYFAYSFEKLYVEILHAQNKRPVTKALVLVDANGISLRKQICSICMPTLIQWAVGTETHFPQIFAEIIIINAPSFSIPALNAVRPFMTKDLRDRLSIFDTNRKQWEKYLDARVDKTQRTTNYAGVMAQH